LIPFGVEERVSNAQTNELVRYAQGNPLRVHSTLREGSGEHVFSLRVAVGCHVTRV